TDDHRNLNVSRFIKIHSGKLVKTAQPGAVLIDSLSTKGAVADLPLQHTSRKHDYRRVQGNKHNMENFELQLRSTLFASWWAANIIRLNLKKLIYVQGSGDNAPSDYARWAHIGDLLLNPELAEDGVCSRLYVKRAYFDYRKASKFLH